MVYTQYGPPEVVRLQEIDIPMVKAGEVLIKIHATTVNRTDCGFRSANYFIVRFFSGLFKPRAKILGCEFAGEIEAVGGDVSNFKPGDRVFGYDDTHFGGHGEYKVMAASGALAMIPEGMNYIEAAPLTEGSHYALGNIRAAKVKKGDTVMVYGATGAIGSAAVQLLKHFGAYVVAVSNTKNVELVTSLGADEVIDYQTQRFAETTHRFDFVFDAVGKCSFHLCKPLLKSKGIYISTELGRNSENVWLALFTPMGGGRKVLFPLPTINQADVLMIRKLAGSGDFKPVIDRTYPLEQLVEAYQYVETGQKTGNVVITLENSDRL
ncbi:NADPH:quinone reductase [Parapedobacter indicus]|uniref:NADPH:quinone reductase n=2 Tax=Parapedobacter indicus TaxID=1477437 RepID=A0A1I3DN09_9SPHI|nr:NADPH:quinone reductase-like Zn-dependent oxidoreductase [Parapedobacter indicus]SFH87881.1 NADPH:quinone reductase [Parapedobacter indicus]